MNCTWEWEWTWTWTCLVGRTGSTGRQAGREKDQGRMEASLSSLIGPASGTQAKLGIQRRQDQRLETTRMDQRRRSRLGVDWDGQHSTQHAANS